MTLSVEGYRLNVEVPEVPNTLPSPPAQRAADQLRALRATLS